MSSVRASDLTSLLFPGGILSLSTLAVALVTYSLLSLVVSRRSNKRKEGKDDTSFSSPFESRQTCLPPMIPGSVWYVLQRFTDSDAPMWLHEVMSQSFRKNEDSDTTLRSSKRIFRLPLHYLLGVKTLCVIGDVQVARRVLNDPQSTKPHVMYRLFDQMSSGVSFFTSEGHRYHHVRKQTSVAFQTRVIQKTVDDIVQNTLKIWIETVLIQTCDSVDIVQEMQLLTVSIIAQSQFDCDDLSREEALEILSCLSLAIQEYGSKCALRPYREWFWFLFVDGIQARRATRKVKSYCRNFLDKYRERTAASDRHDCNRPSIVALIDRDDQYANDEERLTDMAVFFLAGYDTTAHSLAFLLKSLAKNPSIQSELRTQLQSDSNPYISSLMRHCVKESARLHPVASLGSARVLHSDLLVDDASRTIIPKNSIAMIPFYLLGRNEQVFEHPEEFIPTRWEEATRDMNESVIPFSIGRRNCIGQSLATAEQFWIVGQLVREYEISLVEEGTVAFCITLTTKGTRLSFQSIR